MGKLVKSNKCFEDGTTVDEVREMINEIVTEINNKISVLKGLIEENCNSTSNFLNELQNKIDKSGGSFSGEINVQSVIPAMDSIYNLGSADKKFNRIYTNRINFGLGHEIAIGWVDSSGVPFFKVDNNPGTYYAVSSDNQSVKLNWVGNDLEVFVNGTKVGNIAFKS